MALAESQLPLTLVALLEAAFNNYLALDAEGPARMKRLAGRVIALDILGLDLSLYILPAHDGVQILSRYEGEADTRLRGAPVSLMRMGISRSTEDQLFSGDVEISGDTELGQEFKQILDQMDIDWEEHLSHLTGDVIAHQLGHGLRSLLNWGRHSAASLALDTSEYLQEESRLVVPAVEIQDFSQQVDVLRNDTERLEARIRRVQQHLQGTAGAGQSTS